jgi:Kef-type K+ transport system membrane component KefB
LTGTESVLNTPVLQMSLLMFVALAGYLVAYRINQSAVVGIILAGIVVGPSLLRWVTYTDFVSSLANLGAVILLFTIGLEFSIKDIAKVRYLSIALIGVIVPALAGFFLATAFRFDFRASIFVGTALTATSIAITANVLREMGRLNTEAARAIIGAAVIDDILALLALSVSEGLVGGGLSLASLLLTAAKAIAFLSAGILVGKPIVNRLIRLLDSTRVASRYPESILIFAVMVAFMYALVAELVGLSAIVGSFMAGAGFAGLRLKSGVSFKEGSEHLQVIFASIFFVSLGVVIDLHTVDFSLIWFVLALTGVAIASKIVGCGIPAALQRMGMRDSLAVGVGMVPRGEVAMIVALLGLSQGLINQSVYTAVILMSLLTTVLPPFWLKRLFLRKGPG